MSRLLPTTRLPMRERAAKFYLCNRCGGTFQRHTKRVTTTCQDCKHVDTWWTK